MEASNGAQPAGDERRRHRKPATGFPVLDLGEAASVLARASQHGWEHTVAEIAGYMGHATTAWGSPASQGQFGEAFARSAAAAGLAETTGDGKITLVTKPQARSSGGENPGSADRSPGDNPPAQGQPADRSALKPVLNQHWPFPDGEIRLTVTIARPLSAADFASIGLVVAQIEEFVVGLTGGDGNA